MLTGYGSGNMPLSYDPALSASHSSPASQQYEYGQAAIDPALQDAPIPAAVNIQYSPQPGMPYSQADFQSTMHSSGLYGASNPLHLRGGGSSFIFPIASAYKDSADTTSPGKRTVSDLLNQLAPPPPPPSSDITQHPGKIDELKHLYYSIYAPGLESFTESKWFPNKGLQKILGDKQLLELFGSLLDQFAKTASVADPKEFAYTAAVETRVVWALANMVRSPGGEVNGNKNALVPAVDDPHEAGHRLAVFEALLTGQVAGPNMLTQPVPGSTDHHRLRELEFWYNLGNFVSIPYEDQASAKPVDDTLSALRNLLDGRENRDVLYSIAVIRAIGQRVSEYSDSDTPLHLDESDNKSKLGVAKKFIMDEGSGNGTTNVIRRLCELAARTWATAGPAPAASSA